MNTELILKIINEYKLTVSQYGVSEFQKAQAKIDAFDDIVKELEREGLV